MFSSTDQLPLACSLVCTVFKVNLYLLQCLSVTPRFSTAMFLLRACCPRQSCQACSRHFVPVFQWKCLFLLQTQPSTSGPGGVLSTDYGSLQVRLLQSAAFSVSFVRALQPAFHSLSPELGLVCAGLFLLFQLGWPPCSWFFIHVGALLLMCSLL